jgi:heme exporter protein B
MFAIAWLVMKKDLLIERRTRVVMIQVVPFGVMALVLCGLALGPVKAGSSGSGPGLFYVVLFLVSMLIVNRSQSIEASTGTRASIATLALDPGGVFLGKAAAVAVELLISATLLASGAVLLLHTSLLGTLRAAPSIFFTTAALAAAGTLYGVLAGGGGSGATLLPVLAIPGYAPLLIAGERGYSEAIAHASVGRWWAISLISFVVYSALGVLLYGVVDES